MEASSDRPEGALPAVARASSPESVRWSRRREWRDPLLRRMLALADTGAVLVVAVVVGIFGSGLATSLWAALSVPAWILLAKLCGLYDRDHRVLRHLTVDELPGIFIWATTGTAGLALLLHATPTVELGAAGAIRAWVAAAGSASVLRAVARIVWRRLTPPERTVLVGHSDRTHAIRRKFELFADIHVDVVDERDSLVASAGDDAQQWLAGIDRLILSSDAIDERLVSNLIAACRQERVKLSVIPPERGMFGTAVQLKHIADLPVVEYNTWDVSRSTLVLKRGLDLLLGSVALILTLPLFILIAVAIRCTSRGPVYFVQSRAGLGGREFRMIKFRTMVAGAEEALSGLVRLDELREPVFKLADDPRVTRIGRVLRRTSLDELPQLLNVIRADMSLVGPRPEQVELVRRYESEHLFRLAVRPGMTGPMQVFGRGELTFEERIAVEREYIENLSLTRDLRILALTIPSVMTGRGAF